MRRLLPSEKKYVENTYKENVLFRALFAPCKARERTMKEFRMSAEEVFVECLSLMDDVKECGDKDNLKNVLEGKWNALFCEMRDMCGNAPEAELQQATNEVLSAAAVLLSYSSNHRDTYASVLIMQEMVQAGENIDLFQKAYMEQIWKVDEQKVRKAVQEYMACGEYLSDKIFGYLKRHPQEEVVMGAEEQKVEKRLTNRQTAILISQLLDVPISSEFINIKGLAKLISMVSGNSEGSIRQLLIKMKDIDYAEKTVMDDITEIVDLLNDIQQGLGDGFQKKVIE